jgi:hypothetical protein
MKQYCVTGRRNHGRALKRLLNTWDRNGSTGGPTPWQIDDDDCVQLSFHLRGWDVFYTCLSGVRSVVSDDPIRLTLTLTLTLCIGSLLCIEKQRFILYESRLSWNTNSMDKLLLVKLIVFHLLKGFPSSCGTSGFIATFTTARTRPCLSYIKLPHS